jgi:hypothetical protein
VGMSGSPLGRVVVVVGVDRREQALLDQVSLEAVDRDRDRDRVQVQVDHQGLRNGAQIVALVQVPVQAKAQVPVQVKAQALAQAAPQNGAQAAAPALVTPPAVATKAS